MKSRQILLFVLVGFISACSLAKSQNKHLIINKKLDVSYDNFGDSFNKLRTPLIFGSDHIATNCKTYFKLAFSYSVNESVNNMIVRNEYLTCDAIKILSESKRVETKNTNVSKLGEALLKKLDLRTFASSLSRLSNEKLYTLTSLFPKHISSRASTALFETKDWILTLEVVAIAKINNNSTPDWIVWMFDESKSGNYHGYSTLIIYDPGIQKNYSATPYP